MICYSKEDEVHYVCSLDEANIEEMRDGEIIHPMVPVPAPTSSEYNFIPTGILPDHEIERCIKIDPFAITAKRPGMISYGASSYGYDCRLGSKYKIFNNSLCGVIDPKNFNEKNFVNYEGKTCLVPPNSFVLAESLEYFEIPRDVIAICLGKSSYARCGILVNVTPLEPEWAGKITIEISNTTPLPAMVYSGEGIMQILFLRALSPCKHSYQDRKGKYQNQEGLTLPKVD